jgi:hypothetical protein
MREVVKREFLKTTVCLSYEHHLESSVAAHESSSLFDGPKSGAVCQPHCHLKWWNDEQEMG